MGHQLLIGRVDLHVGTRHRELPLVLLTLHGCQRYAFQQVDACTALRSGSDGGKPLARRLVNHPTRGGRNRDGYHVAFLRRGHGILAHLECYRSVRFGAVGLRQAIGRNVCSTRGHGCHDESEQHKYLLLHILFTLMFLFFFSTTNFTDSFYSLDSRDSCLSSF